ncbi:unnamed protein product, partial [Allacma fusca]
MILVSSSARVWNSTIPSVICHINNRIIITMHRLPRLARQVASTRIFQSTNFTV